ncbi:MAG: HAD family hydrolase [Acutalibacteraceae bacterium]
MFLIKAVIFDMYETLITQYKCPLYFGKQIAIDAGIGEEKFYELWSAAEEDRTVGKIILEEILEKILKENGCYSEKKLSYIVNKRIKCKEEAFEHLHTEIIPMLKSLKEKGILIGLISNCFSEESAVIKKSILYPFFDVACLSYDMGIQKPNKAIFNSCIEKLNLQPDECLYVGDGGSFELETAKSVGMKAVQAVWYINEVTEHPSKRKPEFEKVETPLSILDIL